MKHGAGGENSVIRRQRWIGYRVRGEGELPLGGGRQTEPELVNGQDTRPKTAGVRDCPVARPDRR